MNLMAQNSLDEGDGWTIERTSDEVGSLIEVLEEHP
jgi:hypothetical protein